MNLIVTCGPSFEPIDEVRRLTNFSTGELGVLLSRHLAGRGHTVHCLKGSGATCPGPEAPCQVERFDTNDDLLTRLKRLADTTDMGAVFHAAALCDYRVKRALNAAGQEVAAAKIPSRSGGITLELEPATKVIVQLRGLFPRSLIAGWKFELVGSRADALAAAHRQLAACGTDACVLNGRAAGSGFTFLPQSGAQVHAATKALLAVELAKWLDARAAAA